MGAEVDSKEVLDLFDDMLNVGTNALEFMTMDFWEISTERANIEKGTLRGSIQADKQSDHQWIVGTNLEYAPYVHDGTPPHEIKAKSGKALGPITITGSYLGVSKSGKAFFKVVHHPGYKGNPFFDDSLEIIERQLDEYVGMAMKAIT